MSHIWSKEWESNLRKGYKDRIAMLEQRITELAQELREARMENTIKYGTSHPEIYKDSFDCNWTQTDCDTDLWEADCGMSFMIDEGKPSENNMVFCCKCGKPLVEHLWQDEEIDDEPAET